MRKLSAEATRAIFSPESDSDLYILLTIHDPEGGEPLYLTDGVGVEPDGSSHRLASYTDSEEFPDQVVYGVTSRGIDYIFVPMQITLPQEEESQIPRASIVINDVTRFATPLIRRITAPPRVDLELVLSKTPNIVEASFNNFYITNFTYNADSITAELSLIDYDREPFPVHSFSPLYFPGLF